MEEMVINTTAFIRGEVVAASKKKGKFQLPPPMVTLVEIEAATSFVTFTMIKGIARMSIEELMRAGKLSRLIKEIKHGRDQSRAGKKETPAKDKTAAIYMTQSWQRMTRQKVTQNFERVREITFPPLSTSSRVEGPLVIEAEIDGHMIHHIDYIICGTQRRGDSLENFKVTLHPDFPDQEVAIRGTLSTKRRTELCSLLKENLDIFAW
uniref:Reverse transcriptase domain-containing protein n=1 Tax=Tanacetum cinerariifolium TaxID=118510 RepID=A0A699JJZ5_TANCI|nr:hypothetical protein [Tanacetum cinerariifolium]